MRRLAAAVPLALLGAFSACSLLVDTNGLREEAGGGNGTAEGGALVDAPGPGNPDGPAPGIDSGADATPADGAVPGSVCDGAHAFCDDFETGTTDLAVRWDEIITSGGPLTLDATRVKSGARALQMHLDAKGDGRSRLSKTVTVTNKTARVAVDFYATTPAGTFTEVDPIGVELLPTPAGYGFYGFYFVIRGSETFLQSFGEKSNANFDERAPVPFTKDGWHHLVFSFSYATSPPQGSMSLDGVTYPVKVFEPLAPTQLKVQLGAPYAENVQTKWELSFDNVVVDTP